MMSFAAASSQHYFQGGYDLDFVQPLDPKHECPICLLCTRDPYQTSCGHRFCHSCILTWLSEGKTCPHDNSSLGEGDIYPDPMAQREVLQLMVHCPLAEQGCTASVRLSDVEQHIQRCTFRSRRRETESTTCGSCGEIVAAAAAAAAAAASSSAGQVSLTLSSHKLVCPNAQVACTFASAGCTQVIRRQDLALHLETQTQHHLLLLWEKMQKVQQLQSALDCEAAAAAEAGAGPQPTSFHSDALCQGGAMERGDRLRLSGSNLHAHSKLIRDLYHRIVTLEQKNCRIEIENERLTQRMEALQMEHGMDTVGRFCNGRFVWTIAQFSQMHAKMRRNHSFVLYSPGFYSSAFGYRLCLRCNVHLEDGVEYLGLFVHLMRGTNDNVLGWPFAGRIELRIMKQQGSPEEGRARRGDLCETLVTPEKSKAFERPTPDQERHPIGFGLHQFIRINGLFSGGFLLNDTIVIRARVCVDNDD